MHNKLNQLHNKLLHLHQWQHRSQHQPLLFKHQHKLLLQFLKFHLLSKVLKLQQLKHKVLLQQIKLNWIHQPSISIWRLLIPQLLLPCHRPQPNNQLLHRLPLPQLRLWSNQHKQLLLLKLKLLLQFKLHLLLALIVCNLIWLFYK